MRDFSVAIGLVLAIEGHADGRLHRFDAHAHGDRRPRGSAKLRGIGLGAAFLGVAIVWASRSLL